MLVSGLFAKGIINSNRRIKLPPAFTNAALPDTKGEVATPNIVKAHKHIAKYS